MSGISARKKSCFDTPFSSSGISAFELFQYPYKKHNQEDKLQQKRIQLEFLFHLLCDLLG